MAIKLPRDFGFGEDEALLRDMARKFLDENLPVETLRNLVAGDPDGVYARGESPAWDAGFWKQIVELGWSGLAVPEALGGVDARTVGLAGLLEEAGRHALPSPLLATLCASLVLRQVDSPEGRAWQERIAAGSAASLAITDATGDWSPRSTGVTARSQGSEVLLSGAAHFVQDGAKAEVLIVSARSETGHFLCAVPTDSAGLELRPDQILDLTRDQATAHFRDLRVPAQNLLCADGAGVLERAWPALLVAVSADLCGVAEWQLQTTVEYAKQRKQFDRPIAFFQAVKHPLVDAMIAIDRARSLLYHAASCIDAGHPDAARAARMAKSAASDAGAFISDKSVQLHGGIGFTWECDVHLFFKRSLHDQALYGDGSWQRRLLADEILGPIGG